MQTTSSAHVCTQQRWDALGMPQEAARAHVCTRGRAPVLGDLVLESEAQATPAKHKAPITLDGPYPKRSRRVARALRTWRVALALIIVAVLATYTCQSLRHFMG